MYIYALTLLQKCPFVLQYLFFSLSSTFFAASTSTVSYQRFEVSTFLNIPLFEHTEQHSHQDHKDHRNCGGT